MQSSLKITFPEHDPLRSILDAVGTHHGRGSVLEREVGVSLHVRGNDVTLEGDAEGTVLVERLLRQMYALVKGGRPLDRADVARALEVLRSDQGADLRAVFEDYVLPGRAADGGNASGAGKSLLRGVAPRSLRQKHYLQCMRSHSLTFGVGPAGTGKTFLAVAAGVRMLLDKEVRRIVIARPAIEAGESLGFLPGTLEEKIGPYLRPIYDAMYDLLDLARVNRMLETGEIEIAPLAYMRGRTLNHAFVILDEAQNTTREQMKMVLTRMGQGSRVVVTGDPSQVDLPVREASGLTHALDVLRGVEGIAVCTFADTDIMRHPLVQSIVRAYERHEPIALDRGDARGGPGRTEVDASRREARRRTRIHDGGQDAMSAVDVPAQGPGPGVDEPASVSRRVGTDT